MINYQQCPICSSIDIHEVLKAKDHTVSQEIFSIWQCQQCSLRFTQSIPEAKDIGKYYQSGDYISHSDTKKGLVNNLYHIVRNYTLQQKMKLIQKYTGLDKGKLLDVGCGTGSFLSVMKTAGWQVNGLEPDEEARAIAVQKNISVDPVDHLFSFPPASFDAITLWHVLEHVHELHRYMDQLKKLLTVNGVIFIAVPNYTSADARHYGETWAAYDVPRHLYHFSPAAMSTLVSLHGLKEVDVLPMWFDSFYVSMLSEKYRSGNIVSAILEGARSNINTRSHHKQCSSLIYVIKAV